MYYGEEGRSLGIWFRDDVENILLAIDEANRDVVSRFDAPEVRIYRQGFAAAIGAVALAFGIPPQIIVDNQMAKTPGGLDVRRGSWQLLEDKQHVT